MLSNLKDAWSVLTGSAVATPLASVVPDVLWRGKVGLQSNAWRNRNPSNLRPPSTWKPEGMVGVYNNPENGKFCIFGTEAYGWQAMAERIFQLVDAGKDTTLEIISIWAPPHVDGNNTDAYVDAVAGELAVNAHTVIDPHKLKVMVALGNAIRRHEGKGSDPAWDPKLQVSGFLAAGCEP